jgi:RHS repeat-associated protein
MPDAEVLLSYDAFAQRTVKETSAETTLYAGDSYRRHVTASNPTEARHVYRVLVGGVQIAQVTQIQTGDDISDTWVQYLHQDVLGSTAVITDAAGAVEHDQAFDPFGRTDNPGWTETGVLTGFTGHEHDPEMGLINMRGRVYDAALARFLTADPFVQNPMSGQGLNRYSYVENSPMNGTDPSGFGFLGLSSDDDTLSIPSFFVGVTVATAIFAYVAAGGDPSPFAGPALGQVGVYGLDTLTATAPGAPPGLGEAFAGEWALGAQAGPNGASVCGNPGQPACGAAVQRDARANWLDRGLDAILSEFLRQYAPMDEQGRRVSEALVDYEIGAPLVLRPNGTLRLGNLSRSTADPDSIKFDFSGLQRGERIVGLVHTHPIGGQRFVLSTVDVSEANRLSASTDPRLRGFRATFILGQADPAVVGTQSPNWFQGLVFEPNIGGPLGTTTPF